MDIVPHHFGQASSVVRRAAHSRIPSFSESQGRDLLRKNIQLRIFKRLELGSWPRSALSIFLGQSAFAFLIREFKP